MRQRNLLKRNPAYKGAFLDNWLAGYIRTAEWTIEDELPFASEVAGARLRALQDGGMTIDPLLELGVSALVVSNRLDEDVQYDIAEHFLEKAIDSASALGYRAVNIVMTDHDPILEAVQDSGFQPTGGIANYSGSVMIRRLYTIPLDS